MPARTVATVKFSVVLRGFCEHSIQKAFCDTGKGIRPEKQDPSTGVQPHSQLGQAFDHLISSPSHGLNYYQFCKVPVELHSYSIYCGVYLFTIYLQPGK